MDPYPRVRRYSIVLSFPLLLWSTCCVPAVAAEGDSIVDMQGLSAVRDAAREFVARENAKDHTNWQVADPDARIAVWRCAVPLKARWEMIWWSQGNKATGQAPVHRRRVVAVTCAQPANSRVEKWTIKVPVSQRN